MKQEMVQISKKEYDALREKSKIADDAIVQLRLSLEDLRQGRVSRF